MNEYKPETIDEAIKDLEIFFLADLYTKFKPEEKVGNEIWKREDYFKNFDEFQKYLQDHFGILKKQIKELLEEASHKRRFAEDDRLAEKSLAGDFDKKK